jgi:hypothetical protein
MNTLLYYMHDRAAEFRFQLSGDLSGDSVRDVEQSWCTASSTIGERRFVVDITNLSSIDESGRELIEKWHRRGALLVVKSCNAKTRIQRMVDCPVTLLETDRRPFQYHSFYLGLRWFVALLTLFKYRTTDYLASDQTSFSVRAVRHDDHHRESW